MNSRKIALALTLLAGTLAAGAAQAGGPEVQLSVTLATPSIRLPGHVMLPLPPIPVPRLVVVQPNRNIAYPEPRYERGHDNRGYDRGYGHVYSDVDRDGIPDRRDAVYNPRWDRDGDGVPNRYDTRPDDPRYSRGWQEARRDSRDGRDSRRDGHDDRRDDRHDDRRDGHRGR